MQAARLKPGYALLGGALVGAGAWAVVPVVSDRFEPFDSLAGFYIGQSALALCAFGIAYRHGVARLMVFLLGAYAGLNAYPLVFGSSEHRVWVVPGLLTNLALLVYPFASGVLAWLIWVALDRARKRRARRSGSDNMASGT